MEELGSQSSSFQYISKNFNNQGFQQHCCGGTPHTEGEQPAWAATGNLSSLFFSQQVLWKGESAPNYSHQQTGCIQYLTMFYDARKEIVCPLLEFHPVFIFLLSLLLPLNKAALNPEAVSDDICIDNKLNFTLKFSMQTHQKSWISKRRDDSP